MLRYLPHNATHCTTAPSRHHAVFYFDPSRINKIAHYLFASGYLYGPDIDTVATIDIVAQIFKVVLSLRMTYLGHLRAIAPTGMIN